MTFVSDFSSRQMTSGQLPRNYRSTNLGLQIGLSGSKYMASRSHRSSLTYTCPLSMKRENGYFPDADLANYILDAYAFLPSIIRAP